MKTEYGFRLGVISALLVTVLVAALPSGFAYAGNCDDGTNAPEVITCIADPVIPDDDIGLGLGDDTFTDVAGVTIDSVSGDSLDDGSSNTGDGGNDDITINGDVNTVDGDTTTEDGGNDSITINGKAGCVSGDFVDGNGGNDTITINGDVSCSVSGDDASGKGGDDEIIVNNTGTVGDIYGDYAATGGDDKITIDGQAFSVVGDEVFIGDGGNDTIIVNGESFFVVGDSAYNGDGAADTIYINGIVFAVMGDGASGNGGNDLIIINGSVLDNVSGDAVDADGGNDTIVISGHVDGDILGDDALGMGGNDTVTLNAGAIVGGLINGEGGFDSLQFGFLTPSQLAAYGLNPAGGSLTYGGTTYTWKNFEQLIGLLAEIAEETGWRILYKSGDLVAVDKLDGIAVFAEHGRIAFISFTSLEDLAIGASQNYTTPNSAGWYVTVTNLGVNPDNPINDLFQVDIYSADGGLQASFTFKN